MAGQIAARRLSAQRLIGEPFRSPVDAVRWMGAVQSQDYTGGKWALGLRSGATGAALDRLFDDGAILRTHVLRPTWHFVLPEDVRWLLDLTGPRGRARVAGRYRDRELDDRVVTRALAAFAAALRDGRHSARVGLGELLGAPPVAAGAHLLPNFDEYTVGYRDRSATIDAGRPVRLEIFSLSSLLSSSVIVAGIVRGAWRRVPSKTGVRIDVRVVDRLTAGEVAAVETAGRQLGRHLEEQVELVWIEAA